jgi:DNA primase
VVAAYSPRLRPGVPVSFPIRWDELDTVTPLDFTIHDALAQLAGRPDVWAETMAHVQQLPRVLVDEGREIPVPRVSAMHEGKRRKRARGAS